jgi:hypothetical protein
VLFCVVFCNAQFKSVSILTSSEGIGCRTGPLEAPCTVVAMITAIGWVFAGGFSCKACAIAMAALLRLSPPA